VDGGGEMNTRNCIRSSASRRATGIDARGSQQCADGTGFQDGRTRASADDAGQGGDTGFKTALSSSAPIGHLLT